ncbi:hypothetical protein GQO11_02580 [Acinetobacter johnsonii]|uniref:hypothetical protein n=1 Tax=Acinetobacter johnsonii TaxID=40214 RepID=UPI0013293C23|nr:hypothetical protein [Acinetobacter johnsonii]MWC17571.1 hypothetical protein [Acinetobacter johnsonii]
MNLIEQLGGYAQAKALRALPAATYDCGIKFKREELELSMLEYRRQHNIFEVGDKVVVKDHPFWPEDYVIHTVEQEHIGKWYMSAWRHAEPEELEAGKRLEVKSEN